MHKYRHRPPKKSSRLPAEAGKDDAEQDDGRPAEQRQSEPVAQYKVSEHHCDRWLQVGVDRRLAVAHPAYRVKPHDQGHRQGHDAREGQQTPGDPGDGRKIDPGQAGQAQREE